MFDWSNGEAGSNRFSHQFEQLEQRMMLCATPAEALAAGVPASMIMDDGHIRYSDFITLAPKLQAHIDPHMVQAPLGEDGPINFDQILGIPAHPERSNGGFAPLVGDELPDFYPATSGGFSIDQTSQSGRTLLRFGTNVNNMGSGPGTFISGRPGIDPIPNGAPITSWVAPDGSQNVLQAVYAMNTQNTAFVLDHYLASGHFTYHTGHGHFHFDGYAAYRLRYSVGGVPGDYVQRSDGTGVVGAKTGFCLINVNGSFTLPNGQSSTTLAHYNTPGQPSTGCGFLQGVNVGRADVYSSSLEGQWLDVSGVPSGNYFLEIQLDGENAMIESDEANNTKTFAVTLNASGIGGITPDLFDTGGVHNDSLATAADMGVMGTFTQTGLNIHWGFDFDYFEFTASSTGTYTLSTTAAQGNVDLYLFDVAGTQLGASTNPSGTDTVTFDFVKGTSYYARANCYNSTTSTNYQLAWTLKPTVDATMPSKTVAEENANGSYFTIMRNGPTNTALTVPLTITGNAVSGVDYQPLPSSIVIDANASFVNIPLFPIDNGNIDPKRTVRVTPGNSSAFVVGTTGAITIVDQDGAGRGGASAMITSRFSGPSVFGNTQMLLDMDQTRSDNLAVDLL